MTLSAFHGSEQTKEQARLRIFDRRARGLISRASDNAAYFEWGQCFADDSGEVETLLGIPTMALDFGSMLYQHLKLEEALTLPAGVIELIPVGANLSPVFFRLVFDLVTDPEVGAIRYADQEEQHLLLKLSKLLTPNLERARYREALEMVNRESEALVNMKRWNEYLAFAIHHICHLALATVGARVHEELDLSYLIRKLVHWNLKLESYYQCGHRWDRAFHSPETAQVSHLASLGAATKLCGHYLNRLHVLQ